METLVIVVLTAAGIYTGCWLHLSLVWQDPPRRNLHRGGIPMAIAYAGGFVLAWMKLDSYLVFHWHFGAAFLLGIALLLIAMIPGVIVGIIIAVGRAHLQSRHAT